MRSRFTLAALALALLSPPLHAQKKREEPKRPKLAAGADTNDARVYYELGRSLLKRDPDGAADAFYWAARLSPGAAEPYYGRRVALLLTDPRRLDRYWSGDRRTLQSDDIRRIDSLQLRALEINPFLYRQLDADLFDGFIDNYVHEATRGTDESPEDLRYAIDTYLNRAGPATQAWRAYTDGRFREALDLYAKAIQSARHKAGLRTDRGRLFFQLAQADSALAELTQALQEMRTEDRKDLVYVYESKALLEHSIGLVQLRLGNTAAAKEAFGRALEEDLSYAPAHMQLAYMALDAKDTATALNELDLATQVAGDDPAVRYQYGYFLAAAGKHAEAQQQFATALQEDPVYAAPHFGIARSLDAQGKRTEALAEYRTFLANAAGNDPLRADVERRITALAGAQ